SGTGGHGRKALEGKGPTPKAEDRSWHVAGKRKAANDRLEAARSRHGKSDATAKRPGRPRKSEDAELVTGRNSVVEALRARIPATTLYVAARADMDDRMKEALSLATKRDIPVLEVMRQELDRMTGPDAVHQGVALKVPAYEYAHPMDLLERAVDSGSTPLLVALDGVTAPRHPGARVPPAPAGRSCGRRPRWSPRAASCRSAGRWAGRHPRGRAPRARRRACRSRWRRT